MTPGHLTHPRTVNGHLVFRGARTYEAWRRAIGDAVSLAIDLGGAAARAATRPARSASASRLRRKAPRS